MHVRNLSFKMAYNTCGLVSLIIMRMYPKTSAASKSKSDTSITVMRYVNRPTWPCFCIRTDKSGLTVPHGWGSRDQALGQTRLDSLYLMAEVRGTKRVVRQDWTVCTSWLRFEGPSAWSDKTGLSLPHGWGSRDQSPGQTILDSLCLIADVRGTKHLVRQDWTVCTTWLRFEGRSAWSYKTGLSLPYDWGSRDQAPGQTRLDCLYLMAEVRGTKRLVRQDWTVSISWLRFVGLNAWSDLTGLSLSHGWGSWDQAPGLSLPHGWGSRDQAPSQTRLDYLYLMAEVRKTKGLVRQDWTVCTSWLRIEGPSAWSDKTGLSVPHGWSLREQAPGQTRLDCQIRETKGLVRQDWTVSTSWLRFEGSSVWSDRTGLSLSHGWSSRDQAPGQTRLE